MAFPSVVHLAVCAIAPSLLALASNPAVGDGRELREAGVCDEPQKKTFFFVCHGCDFDEEDEKILKTMQEDDANKTTCAKELGDSLNGGRRLGYRKGQQRVMVCDDKGCRLAPQTECTACNLPDISASKAHEQAVSKTAVYKATDGCVRCAEDEISRLFETQSVPPLFEDRATHHVLHACFAAATGLLVAVAALAAYRAGHPSRAAMEETNQFLEAGDM